MHVERRSLPLDSKGLRHAYAFKRAIGRRGPIRVFVHGLQIEEGDWEAARGLPREQLEPLSDKAKYTAAQLGISDEEFSRRSIATHHAMDRHIKKVESIAKLLDEEIQRLNPHGRLSSVHLRNAQGRFEVDVKVGETQREFELEAKAAEGILRGDWAGVNVLLCQALEGPKG